MKKTFAALLLIVLAFSQLNYRAFAETVNMAAIHNNVHEALSGFNTTVVNPVTEINTILNSIVSPHLDLTSILHSVNVGHLTNEVGINVGGHSLEINSNQLVTPSEALALAQVLSAGHQSLDLSTLGNAVAGSLNASLLGNNIDNLVLPNLVTLIDNSHSLLLSGNLVNYGDIQFIGNASLTANNVYNTSSAEIQGNSNLTINTNQSLINEGTIAANNNLALNTPIIFNVGAIESLNGNVNIASLTNLDITSNPNGNFEALNGSINLTESNSSGNNGINLVSGNYLSKTLNINADSGYVQGVTGNITGQINTNADSIHLATASSDMVIGNTHVTGDPTYVDTANGGAIFIDGTITTNGNNIAIIADGTINIASSSNSSINTSGSSNSGNVVMIAGVGTNISYSGSNTTTGVPIPGTAIASGQYVTVSLGLSTGNYGSNIDLVTNNTLANNSAVINTSATSGNAGNVTLVAVANSSGSGGQVLLASTSTLTQYEINAQSSNNGGNVLIISTATGNINGIEVGAINNLGSVSSGTLGLYCAIPTTSGVGFDSTGTQIYGVISPTTTLTNANIQLDSNINAGSMTIVTGGNINVGSNYLSAGSLIITAYAGSFSNNATPLMAYTGSLSVNLQNSNFYMNDSGYSTLALSNTALLSNSVLGIVMNSPNGSIIATGSVTAGSVIYNGTIDLTASGTGSIQTLGGSFNAGTINLNAGTGNIGSSTSSTLSVTTENLSVISSGSSYITNSLPVSVLFSDVSSGGTYYLDNTSGSGISINGAINAGTVSQTGSIILNSNGSIVMTSGALTANNVSLTTNSASNIGASPANPVAINSPNITISASTPGANVYIFDLVTTPVSISNANITLNSTGTFSLQMINNAPISIDGNLTTGSDTGSSSLILATGGSITTTSNTYVVTAGSINISTSTIGTSLNSFSIDTSNLTSTTSSGSAYFTDQAPSLNINASNSANAFTVYMTNNNGSINIAGNLTTVNDSTGSVKLVVGAYGTITSSNSALITTGNLQLISTYGNIGSNSQALLTDCQNLTVTSQASAYVNDSATSVNLNASSVASTGTLSLSMSNLTAGSIVVNGNVSAGADNGTGVIILSASGTGNITSASSTDVVTAGTVNLATSGGNIIGVNSIYPVYVDTSALSINTTNGGATTGNAFVNDSATSVNLNNSSFGNAGGSFELSMSNVTAGSIVINGNVTDGTDTGSAGIILNASGTGTITTAASTDVLTAGYVNLNTSGGNIGATGSGGQSVLVDTGALSIITTEVGSTTGNAYVSDSATSVYSGMSVGNAGTLSLIMTNATSGSIVVGSNVTAGADNGTGVITLNASGSGTITTIANGPSGFILTAGTVNLATSGGNIGTTGSGGQPVLVDTGALLVSTTNGGATTGSAYVSDSSTSVNLNNSSVGNAGTLSLSMSNPTAGSLVVNGNVTAGADNGTGVIILNASGSGAITYTSSSILTAGSVYLTAGTGNIGNSGVSPIITDTSALAVNTTGNVYLNDSSSVINLAASTGNVFNLLSLAGSGNLTVTGALTASSISITTSGAVIITNANVTAPTLDFTTSGNAGITINSQVGSISNSSNDVINAGGYLTTGTGGVIIGNSLSLVSVTGEIGFGVGGLSPLNTQASNITFNAPYSVGISNTSANLNFGTSSTNGNFYIYQSGNVMASGTITAPVLGLYSFSGSSGIGSSTSLIQVNSADIGLQSYATGSSVYVNDLNTGNTYLQASQASLQAGNSGTGGVFKLNTAGPLSIYAQIDHNGVVTPGNVSAQIIAIQAFDANNGYGIYNDANITSNDFIFLTASQVGYIAQSPTTALMTAPNIALVTGGGAIGAGSQLLLNSGLVAASTQGINGFVNINDASANSGIFGGQSGSNFTFNSNGNLNVFGSIGTGAGSGATGGSITLNANGVVNLGTTSPINLTTNNGSVTVQNNDTTSGSINVAKGDFILGSSTNANYGFVTLNIGSLSQANTINPNMANMAVKMSGGANVYFGNNGITSMSGGNILYANGRSIIFNTGSLSANAITLGGNVSITADPPVTAINSQILLNNSFNNTLNSSNNNLINVNTNFGAMSSILFNNNIATASTLNIIQSGLNPLAGNTLDIRQSGMYTSTVLSNPDNVTNDANLVNVENTQIFEPIVYTTSVLLNEQALNNTPTAKSLAIGSSLIAACHDLTLTSNNATITLKQGSIVLAVNNGNVLSLYNLHDNHKNSVLINIGNKAIALNPACHISISKHFNSFESINPIPVLGYRGLQSNIINGITIYQSDYSILSLVNAIKPVKTLFMSSNKAYKHYANQILKTASVVNASQTMRGAYSQILKSNLTALK